MSQIDDDCLPVKKMRRVRDEDDTPIRSSPPARVRPPAWMLAAFAGIALSMVTGTGGFFAGRAGVKTGPVAERAPANAPAATPAANAGVPTPAGTDPAPPARKTFSRDEMKYWLAWNGNAPRKTAADIKAKFGPPDATMVVKGNSFRTGTPGLTSRTDYLEYYYDNFSIDSEGSGKADRRAVIQLYEYAPHEYVRIEFIP